MLEVRDLSVAYGDLRVLWGVGFTVRPGELVALIGPNGAGKSTTLKAIAGLIGVGLVPRPPLLVLAEPSLGLGPLVVDHLYDTIARLRREGLTILLVEQQIFLALELADRAYVIETGRIRHEGSGRALLADPHVQAAYLGGASRPG